MGNCVFCEIVKRVQSAYIIYEDDKVMVFLDKRPYNPGHLLVIPKEHYTDIFDIPDDLLAYLITIVKKMSNVVKNALNASGIRLVQNNESSAGQVIFHFHFHIIPYYDTIDFPTDKQSIADILRKWINETKGIPNH
ncbi:MAG: HIT family protein [Thermoproteales archaeon]|nr:HIT family protein [Thermoproteales archaeon]